MKTLYIIGGIVAIGAIVGVIIFLNKKKEQNTQTTSSTTSSSNTGLSGLLAGLNLSGLHIGF